MRTLRRSRRPPVRALAGLAVLLLAGTLRAGDDFDAARKRYEAYLDRPSLYMRHRGRVRFAETGDPRALEILARSYARPEPPRDPVRHLLATICTDRFDEAAHVPVLRRWREKHDRPEDAWLWYRTLEVELAHEGAAPLLEVVGSASEETALRVAALLQLARSAQGEHAQAALPALPPLLEDLPARPFDRALLLEACAEVLWEKRADWRTEPWRRAAALLIPHLDDRRTMERTKLVIVRRLADVWHADDLVPEAAPWLARLAGGRPDAPAEAGDRYAPPRRPHFLGIEGTGRRVVYVLDLSDSMLTPLTGKEVEDLKRTPPPTTPSAPVTGGDARPPAADAGGKPEAAADPDVLALPWATIRTRFDAARAFLALSLQRQDADTSYCVIGFGSEAAPLPTTPGLVRASRSSVAKTLRALQAIEPGPRTRSRPYGTLRGYTNLHGGLRRAFGVRDRRLDLEDAYVDARTFEHGADTIFVLSDGKPTWDDWPQRDTLDPDNEPGDPESGATVEDAKTATFYGPYAIASWLLDDLRRLNLFRHAEIHAVGLGEYDPRLLQAIVHAGKGRFRNVGQ